jgi:WD40 repeat protein
MAAPRDRLEARLGLNSPPGETVRPAPPTIPDHELVRRIGQGAYGEVWLARNALGTWRAIKIVYRDHFKDARPYEREFAGIRRFEPLSRSNEGFVDILQVGRDDAGGWFYYVMELADAVGGPKSEIRNPKETRNPNPEEAPAATERSGSEPCAQAAVGIRASGFGLASDFGFRTLESYQPRTLARDLLQRGRLPLGDCLELGLTLSLALAHLHRHGLIHRDIKPSNLIFVGGVPKLADIGLVTEAGGANTFVGTEGFLPPEGPTSPRADLYALGKVLYEAAMGKDRNEFPEPFTQLGTDPESVALMELNAVLLRACAPDPAQRYASAEEMHADLALLHSGGSVKRRHQVERQFRLARQVGGVAILLAALVAGGWWWQAGQTRLVRQLAAERSRLADENRRRLVRLAVANGVHELDQGDLGAAVGWLTGALTSTTNDPADAMMQRVRLQQVLALHPRLLQVFPHPAPVRSAGFSPDEEQLVTACDDGRLRLWATGGDGNPRTTLALEGPAEVVRFTRDGRHLFVVERDPPGPRLRASLRDARTGEPRFPPVAGLTCAALSPDDRWLAVARADQVLEVMEAATGAPVARATGHTEWVEQVAFSPDSAVVVSASHDRTVRRWRTTDGTAIGPPLPHDFPVAQVLFNADGSRLATATRAQQANNPVQFQTWTGAAGAPLGPPLPGRGLRGLLAFDPSGLHLLTADREPVAQVWNVDTHARVLPPLATDGPIHCLDFSPDGAWLALGGDDGTVGLWDAETGRPAFTPLRQSGRVSSLQFSRAGTRLLVAGEDGAVRLWDLALPAPARSRKFPTPTRPRLALAAGQSRLLLAASGPNRLFDIDLQSAGLEAATLETTSVAGWGMLVADATGHQWAHVTGPEGYRDLRRGLPLSPSPVELWRSESGTPQHLLLPHPAAVRNAFFHHDGHRLLTVAVDGVTRLWRTADGTLEHTLPWPPEDTCWLGVSPDLRVAVTLAGDEHSWRLVFRDVRTGTPIRTDPEANPDVRLTAYSPDGRRVGIFGGHWPPQIRGAATGEPLLPPLNHGGAVTWLEWSPDGRRILTAGESPEVKVWDATTGAPALPPLKLGLRPVERARFSPDGRFIAARSDDDQVRVWDAATGEALTPALPHRDTIRDVFLTAHDQLVSVQNSGEVRVWELTEVPGSAPDLARYARLVTGRASGSEDPTAFARADELAEELRALRVRRPDWFAAVPAAVPWRAAVSGERPPSVARARAALFHLERQAREHPEDATLRDALARHQSFRIPDREPSTPSRLLDLSRAYTQAFELLPLGDFADLPRGRQTFAGTEFDVRALVQLDHRAAQPGAPGPFHPSAAIEVGQRCRALHFLQATTDDPRVEAAVVARWLVRYADGSAREWPVLYGRHLRDLWWSPGGEPLEASQATLAWRGVAAIGNLPGTEGVRLFKATWTNPQPEVEITRIEIRTGDTSMKPLVVAITAE